MTTVKVFAPAKVNLSLHVTGRRADGYHEIESLVVFASDIGDTISVAPADDLSLHVIGPMAEGVPTDKSNLVLRAARLMREARKLTHGAAITLEKYLPGGGGVGGGSADAAATIRALAQLWEASPLSGKEALALGADLPVCLRSPRASLMRGIGEIVSDAPVLPRFWLVLANPGEVVSTADVFKRLGKNLPTQNAALNTLPTSWDFGDFHVWLLGQHNDLTKCASEYAPAIGTVLDALQDLPGCVDVDMSGSGSTCWGLFEREADALSASETLSRNHREWWVRATAVS